MTFLFDNCTILFGISRDNEPFNLFGVLIESLQIFSILFMNLVVR